MKMSIKTLITLLFVLGINQSVFSATGFGLYNLSIPDEAYKADFVYDTSNLNIKPENAFLFAKISDMPYQTALSTQDNDFIEDNGFQTTQGNNSNFYTYDRLQFLPLTKTITINYLSISFIVT